MRQGYRIDLGSPVLPRLPRKTRNIIRNAHHELYVRKGTLNELRAIHWDPVYLPHSLKANQEVYVAVLDDSLPPISAILVELKGDKVIYRYAGNDKRYKSYNGNSLLLWWIAEVYSEKGYSYIDLGGSTKPSIESFKKKLSTSRYNLNPKPFYLRFSEKLIYHFKRWFINGF